MYAISMMPQNTQVKVNGQSAAFAKGEIPYLEDHCVQEMGGSQSQERIVNVEETIREDGAPQITVTEDFLKYLHNKQVGSEEGVPEGRGEESSHVHEDDTAELGYEEETTPPYMSAENVLAGEQSTESANRQRYRPDEADRWKMKYELEKRKNQTMKEVSSREFDKAANEIREKFNSKTRQSVVPVCEDCKDKVLDCYHSNPGRPLNCTTEAREYFECVERARQRTLQPTASGQ